MAKIDEAKKKNANVLQSIQEILIEILYVSLSDKQHSIHKMKIKSCDFWLNFHL